MTNVTLAKELKKLRIDRDERLLDMAAALKVSPAFLSAVESGRKSAPNDFAERVISTYDLGPSAALTLRLATDASRHTFKLSPRDPLARDTVALLARKLDTLSAERLKAMKRLLEADGDDD